MSKNLLKVFSYGNSRQIRLEVAAECTDKASAETI